MNENRTHREKPAEGVLAIGIGLAALGVAGTHAMKHVSLAKRKINVALKTFQFTNSKYYKGGFEENMTKKEAYQILGISPASSKLKIKEAHKRIMLLNHPDRGGSPYIAAKINEAKDYIERQKP